MHRRGFLAAGLATVLVSPRAIAQVKMDDMPGMDMGGHAGHDMGAAAQGAAVLPEGEALRELPLLANEASTPGLFKAKLTAGSATVRFSVTAAGVTPLHRAGDLAMRAAELTGYDVTLAGTIRLST